jgi:hypothetical protein
MIFRLSQKLSAKIEAGTLTALPLAENPLADWSAALFLVGRTQYILVSNTKSLYSTVLPGKGITDDSEFIDRALSSIRQVMEDDGHEAVYSQHIVPASASVRFAKALDRSVTGSMNDMIRHATYWLAQEDVPPFEVGLRLNDIPMSALKSEGSTHGFPRDVFAEMVSSGGS